MTATACAPADSQPAGNQNGGATGTATGGVAAGSGSGGAAVAVSTGGVSATGGRGGAAVDGTGGVPATGSGGNTATATGGGPGASPTGGASANTGGRAGGTSTGGAGGAAGGRGGASGSAGAGGAGALSSRSFTCTQIHGVSSITAWFNGGFEMEPGIDGSKWQAMATHAAFVETWTDPNNAVWSLPIQSPCTQNSKSPDRIIFNPVNWHYQTEAEWETAILKVLVTLRAKYPAVKRIDLITMVRAPNNVACTVGGASVEQTVLPTLDQAIDAVAAQSGGLVTVGPKLFAPSCAVFSGTTANFNSSSYGVVAKMVAAAFAAEP